MSRGLSRVSAARCEAEKEILGGGEQRHWGADGPGWGCWELDQKTRAVSLRREAGTQVRFLFVYLPLKN